MGDVRYETLEMHQGATIDGELKHLTAIDADASQERPQLKLAAANES